MAAHSCALCMYKSQDRVLCVRFGQTARITCNVLITIYYGQDSCRRFTMCKSFVHACALELAHAQTSCSRVVQTLNRVFKEVILRSFRISPLRTNTVPRLLTTQWDLNVCATHFSYCFSRYKNYVGQSPICHAVSYEPDCLSFFFFFFFVFTILMLLAQKEKSH